MTLPGLTLTLALTLNVTLILTLILLLSLTLNLTLNNPARTVELHFYGCEANTTRG